jgi:putative transposase
LKAFTISSGMVFESGIFRFLPEARMILEQWRVEYNEQRPHSSLGYLTPAEFAASSNPKWGVVSNDLNNPDGLSTMARLEPTVFGRRSRRLQLTSGRTTP